MRNVKVSVVVAIYQAEKYLKRCIDCLKNQTFSDFEVLLIDDGSTDKSGEICEAVSSRDTRFVTIHKCNGGVSSARQLGVERSQGDFIIHVDPDDWFECNMLKSMYERAIQDNADMVISDFYKENGGISEYKKQEFESCSPLDVLKSFFENNHAACWNKLIKSSVIKENNIKFDEKLSYSEDLSYMCDLLRLDIRISYVNEAYYHYVYYPNSSLVNKYNRAIADYDLFLAETILKKTNAYKFRDIAKRYMATSIVNRAYYGNVFSNSEFRNRYFYLRKKWMLNSPLKKMIIMYLSCVGLYRFVYSIECYMRRIKTILR
jgi:glycosyltransferase involved in cell wall biosynthesis